MNPRLPLLLASLSLAACAGIPLPKDKLVDSPGGLIFNGYAKTNIDCFACHNGDAHGTLRGPSLADYVHDSSDSQLADVIKDGQGRMPSHKDRLNDEEIAQILAWLHGTFPSATPPGPTTPPQTAAPKDG